MRVADAAGEEEVEGRGLAGELRALYTILTRELAEDGGVANRARLERMGEGELKRLLGRYERAGSEALRKVGVYLRNGGRAWLTFLRQPGVEPTNNRGKRALREGVVVRKIVGTLRNARGAEVFSRLLTVMGSWRARGENPADRLYAALT